MNTGKKKKDERERFSKKENTATEELKERRDCNFESKVVDKVFELPPILTSGTQQAVSGSPQMVDGQE